MKKKNVGGRPRESMSDKPLGKRVRRLRDRGMSYGEIAEKLGKSRQRIYRIHQRLLDEQEGRV